MHMMMMRKNNLNNMKRVHMTTNQTVQTRFHTMKMRPHCSPLVAHEQQRNTMLNVDGYHRIWQHGKTNHIKDFQADIQAQER